MLPCGLDTKEGVRNVKVTINIYNNILLMNIIVHSS